MNVNPDKTIKSQSESTVTQVHFTDAQFMTARDKQLVLKDWERFLQNGLIPKHFTKRLYEHLHLHCSYIAHYSRDGFFAEYFQSAPDTERFFEYFCQNTERFAHVSAYVDINLAMREAYDRHRTAIRYRIEAEVSRKLGLLESCLVQAKTDNRFAKELLRKIRF